MTNLSIVLLCIMGLFATGIVSIAIGHRSWGGRVVYAASASASIILLVTALKLLSGGSDASSVMTLPLGLPWLGTHLRLDALSAFFLAVINLGGFSASLYAIGYGQHETVPGRVL